MISPYQLKWYYSDEDMEDFKYDPFFHNFNNESIEPQERILLPKFLYKLDAHFGLSKESLLLSRADFLDNIASIDRWYIYLLFDLLTSSDRDSVVIEAAWQIMYALDRKKDQEYGRTKPLLDIDSEEEFPLMRKIYNACYGDKYISNNSEVENKATYYVSYKIPWILMQYLEINPFTGELNAEQVKNYVTATQEIVTGDAPISDLFSSILSFLGIEVQEVGPEGKENEFAWPEYDNIQDYARAYVHRCYLEGNMDCVYYPNQFKIGTLEELVEADNALQALFETEDVPSTDYTRAFWTYMQFINRTTRFLLIGPDFNDTLYQNDNDDVVEVPITTINLDAYYL